MKKVFMFATIKATLILFLASVNFAYADLNSFLSDLNNQAKADITRFNSTLSTQFNLPLPHVQSIVNTVKHPADAFMCLQLSTMTGIQLEKVIQTYNTNNQRGWGAIAKDLGIKPGSDAFHALKQGDFIFQGVREGKNKKKKSKSKNKGKGKKK